MPINTSWQGATLGVNTFTGLQSVNGSGPTSGWKVGADQTGPITGFWQAASVLGILGAGTTTQIFLHADRNGTNNRRLNLTATTGSCSIISDWDSGAIPLSLGAGTTHWQITTAGALNTVGGSGAIAAASLSLTALLQTAASATGSAGINLPHGAAPSAPVNGDMWTTTAGLFVRINGATVGPLS